MSGYPNVGLPSSSEFPPLGASNTVTQPPNGPSSSHNRQPSGTTRRNVNSGTWRNDHSHGSHQRDRAATTNSRQNGTGSTAGQQPRSEQTVDQYDQPWVAPQLSSYKYSQPADTSHVPCKFFRAGECTAGNMCPFSHTLDGPSAQCKYFLKGQCKFGQSCELLHVTPDGRILNGRDGRNQNARDDNLGIGSRTIGSPRGQYHQSTLSAGLSAGGQANTFSHQIPTFTTQPFDAPGSADIFSITQGTSPPSGLTVLDVPMPASFDSQGVSNIARYGPVASSMPGALLGQQSPPSSLPRPIIGMPSAREGARNDFGTSPEANLEQPNTRLLHSQRLQSNGRVAASLPRTGYRFDPSWPQGEDDLVGGEDLIPGDLSELMTTAERARRLSGRNENPTNVRRSLHGYGSPGTHATQVGSPQFSASPSRFSEFFRQQYEAGSPEFQPVSSPLARPSQNMGSNIERLSLAATSRPASQVNTLSSQFARTRLGDSTGTRQASYRSTSNPQSPPQRVVSSGAALDPTVDEELFPLDQDTETSAMGSTIRRRHELRQQPISQSSGPRATTATRRPMVSVADLLGEAALARAEGPQYT